MLKTVLWIAATCAAVLLALAVSRFLQFDQPVTPAPAPEVVEPVAASAPPPAPPPQAAQPAPTPEDVQIQEDAAATGMTTVEPETAPPVN